MRNHVVDKKTVTRYTMLFTASCLTVFLWHYMSGRTFVWYFDGVDQHLQALKYYGSYLREVIKCVFTGHLSSIPSWSWGIGEGGDILQNLHYYVIGEPLTILSAFFSADKMHILYNALAVIRLYLAGLSFIYYSRYMGYKNPTSVSAGAISYTFCLWAIYNTARHPFFVTPLIYLPLLFVGVEKVLKREKSTVFTLTVCLAALSNFYFFYMLVIMTVVYAVIRIITVYGMNIRLYLAPIGRLVITSLTGLLMASVVFIPVAIAFLGDSRNNGTNPFHLIYSGLYYRSVPAAILSPTFEFQLFLCWTAPAIVALVLLFARRKKDTPIKTIFVIAFVCTLIPFFGQLFNGMSYMSNRWAFVFSFLTSLILVKVWDCFAESTTAFWIRLLVGIVAFGAISMLAEENRLNMVYGGIAVLVVFVIVMLCMRKKNLTKYMGGTVVAFVVISATMCSFWLNSSAGNNYAAESRRIYEMNDRVQNSEIPLLETYLSDVNDDTLIRYSGSGICRNAGLVMNASSCSYNWTLSNPYVTEYNRDLEMITYVHNVYDNLDDRAIPMSLSSNRLYSYPEGYAYVPYDTVPVNSANGFVLAENDNAVGLTYSSDRVISQSAWDGMNGAQRQDAMLHGILISDADLSSEFEEVSFSEEECISIDYVAGFVDDEQKMLGLDFEGAPNSETYILFDGLRYSEGFDGPIVVASQLGGSKLLEMHEDGFEYFNGRRDFIVNLGYSEEPLTHSVIAFVNGEGYSYDSLKVICQSFDNYDSEIAQLTSNTATDTVIGADRIDCKFICDETKILLFTVPYSDGWSAEVDGSDAELYRANVKYMALVLPAGEHSITLRYHTPGLILGAVASGVGVILFVVQIIIYRKKKDDHVA